MNNIMVKSARSSVMALARDCSTAICDGHGDVLAFPSGFPVHVGGTSLSGHSLLDLNRDRVRSGDAYLNNSSYHGNTHAADHTILVPVFYENELLFICVCRGHQADVGNSISTTYYGRERWEAIGINGINGTTSPSVTLASLHFPWPHLTSASAGRLEPARRGVP
jgi:N-methylhydantoinase B